MPEVIEELQGMDFVFVCVDNPVGKESIIKALIEKQIRSVDVGIGVEAVNGALTGSARVTTYTAEKCDHIDRRISLAKPGENDYSLNSVKITYERTRIRQSAQGSTSAQGWRDPTKAK